MKGVERGLTYDTGLPSRSCFWFHSFMATAAAAPANMS